jgi:hypothetical protein
MLSEPSRKCQKASKTLNPYDLNKLPWCRKRGFVRSNKRTTERQQPPSKKSKPAEDPVLTADELRLLIPADLKEYVSYATIDEKRETLNQLTGKVDDEEPSNKGTWKDRKKGIQQNAQKGVGMQWRYTPGANGKGKEVERPPSRLQTPAAPSVPHRGPVTPHKPAAGPSASQTSSYSFPIEDDTAEGSGAGEDKLDG